MGNCCMRESSSSVMFAGEDWGSLKKSSSIDRNNHRNLTEKQRLLGEDMEGIDICSSSSSSGDCIIKEVKIKITKRELEALMERVEKQGLTMEQVMANFVLNPSSQSDDQFHPFHDRSWKPALQSIPELN